MGSAHSSTVLVTGAFGNVGRRTVRLLLERGHAVVATDVAAAAAQQAAAELACPDLSVRWSDLRDAEAVAVLVAEAEPDAVVHLAAVIPPVAYANPALARAVNVDGTGHLVRAVAQFRPAARFVFASSIGVYGSRNPHDNQILTAETPCAPRDCYGQHKVEAEALVREAGIDWVVLRLGAVLFPEAAFASDEDTLYLQGILPSDARVEAVDVRDVALALVNALSAPCLGRTMLIGGGLTSRLTQAELTAGLTRAMGLPGSVPPGRPGNPADPDGWFVTDWLDTDEAEALLHFQQHSFADTMDGLAADLGLKRFLSLPLVPLVRLYLGWRTPLRGSRASYVDPWQQVEQRWGPSAVVPPNT